MKKNIPVLVCILVFLASCSKKKEDQVPPPVVTNPPAVTADNNPLLPGNPTQAQPSANFPENYLKDNTYYALAFSRSRNIPVWVAWHFQSEDQGSTPRQDDFRADTQLPTGWHQVGGLDYTGSGFDRGHNCPSADRTSSVAANSSTFLMTNIIPQAPTLNQGPWADLEDFTRNTLVGTSNEAFIVMGNTGRGGLNVNGLYNTIANGTVTVPARIWKVILVIPKGNNDLARIRSTATVLAVNMPNDNTLYSTSGPGKIAWRNYITTISAVEADARNSGVQLDLLYNVADSIKSNLKLKLFQ